MYAATWERLPRGGYFPPFWSVGALRVDPASPATVYAATGNGVFKSEDAGATWLPRNTGLDDSQLYVADLAIDPLTSSTLYASPGGGLCKSGYGVENWRRVGRGLPGWAGGLVIDPNTPSTLYAVAEAEIFKSTDAGAT